jgi:hypothetical protein
MIDSTLQRWQVIATFDTEVPKKILTAIAGDPMTDRILVHDLFIYHGEDGWCLANNSTLKTCERWLNALLKKHCVRQDEPAWLWIKAS